MILHDSIFGLWFVCYLPPPHPLYRAYSRVVSHSKCMLEKAMNYYYYLLLISYKATPGGETQHNIKHNQKKKKVKQMNKSTLFFIKQFTLHENSVTKHKNCGYIISFFRHQGETKPNKSQASVWLTVHDMYRLTEEEKTGDRGSWTEWKAPKIPINLNSWHREDRIPVTQQPRAKWFS